MEGIAITLIGGAIFMHSTHLLGLFSDGRTVGALMAALAAGLLLTLTLEPQLLGTQGTNPIRQLAEVMVLKSIIVMWAIYGVAVAAQIFWDLEDRAIGFYGAGLAAVSGVAFIYYIFTIMFLVYSTVMLEFSIVAAVLVLVATLLILLLAIPLNVMKNATGWAMVSSSIVIVAIGLAMYTTVIAYP